MSCKLCQIYSLHVETQDSPDSDLFDIGCLGGAIQGSMLHQIYSIHDKTQDRPDLFDINCLGGAIQGSMLPQEGLQGPQKLIEVLPGQHEQRGVGEGCHSGGPGLPPQQRQLPKVHCGAQPQHLLQCSLAYCHRARL